MQAQEIIQKSRDFFLSNKTLGYEDRIQVLEKVLTLVKENEQAFCDALKIDLGKSADQAYLTEIGVFYKEANKTIKNLKKWMRPRKVGDSFASFPSRNKVYRCPYGVALIITPWNYPFLMCFEHVFGALAGGNCVVLKPSEFTPETSSLVEKVFHDNFPAGLIRVVNGGVEKSTELLEQNFDHIFFTGSTKVGKIVMQAAAKNLTPVVLELGGKSPCIIDESADLQTAVKRIVWGKFMNCGQTCVAPDYLLVPEKLQGTIAKLLRTTLKEFYGEVIKNSPDYGKIVSKGHLTRLVEILNKGNFTEFEYDLENRFLSPVIWENCDWEMSVMQEEIFGPILPIVSYQSKNEVIEKLKTLPAALALYYFGEDQSFKDQLVNQVPFGGGCFNDTVLHLGNSNLPFGGVKESGMGRYHGRHTFDAFTYEKGVMEKGTLIDPPLRYPPVAKNIGLIKKILG